MKSKTLSTITFCFMVLTGSGFIGRAYGRDIDNVPLSVFLQKWDEINRGQYDRPEDSTSGRVQLIYEIGEKRDPRAIPLLTKILLEDPYACVRAQAALSLAMIEDVSAVPALKKSLITDGNIRVCLSSAEALLSFKDTSRECREIVFSIARGKGRSNWNLKGFYSKDDEKTTSVLESYKDALQLQAIRCLEFIPNDEARVILEEQENAPNTMISEQVKYSKVRWLINHKKTKSLPRKIRQNYKNHLYKE